MTPTPPWKSRDSVFDDAGFARALAPSSQPLAVFRAALKSGRDTLRQFFLAKPDAVKSVQWQAWLVDRLLEQAWALHQRRLAPKTHAALVAVGGYGRGELHPSSDIDLLFLVERDREDIRTFVETLLRFLWDMGLEVGHSVRTLKECVKEAKADITVATNLMEARWLCGDRALCERMLHQSDPAHIWPAPKFFAGKLAEQQERHHRFDDTAYNLEPNVKDGPGGLRDVQMIAWVAQRHFGTGALHELVEHAFLSDAEYRALVRGRNFLWQVRTGLHYLAGRREDRLLFDHQRALAKQFGYRDKPGILAVELFMKRYYRTIKELALLNEIALQHFQETLLAKGRPRIRPISRRFQAHNDFLEVAHPRVFERAPFAMLELFLVLQQHPELKGVRANTIRALRSNLRRIDMKFRRDLACRSLFMEMLRHGQGLTHALRRMNRYGVLGAYLPVFGKIVGQMQHDLFHVYTVDEHILMVVRNLRRFTVPQFRHEFPLASEIIQRLFKPERLYIAGLFHDIAKGRGGDHSVLGAEDAEHFCRLHNLSEYDTRFIAWLVRHHLLMSMTAQRQDISDPEVVRAFAQQVGDQERLDFLYLLTVADMRGTSPKVWNAWKGRLLSQLYSETARALARGVAQPLDVEEHVSDLRAAARAILERKDFYGEHVAHFWDGMDTEYFLRYDADSLAWHAEVIAGAAASDLPLVATRYSAELGGSEFLIYSPDRDDLFVILTGGFDRMNLSIMDARIHTTRAGFALDTFVVLDHAGQPVTEPRALAQLGQALRAQLLHPAPAPDRTSALVPRQLKHFPIETRVTFTSIPGKPLSIMEVVAQDRPGLLYQVALTLQECRVNLVAAKVSTYGERAEDIFFVNTRDAHQPLTDPAQQRCLERGIVERLGGALATPTAMAV